MFEKLHWQSDRLTFNELMFRIEHYRAEPWDGGEHFRFYKIKELVDQYEAFLSRRPGFKPQHVMELGTFDGGSTAFWFELLQPDRFLSLDFKDGEDSEYFKQWVQSRGLKDRVHTYWRTDQANKPLLKKLAAKHFDNRLDLVIDDASHMYAASKASFEALFPLCRPGALYVLEDWAWDHWGVFSDPKHPWAKEIRLTQLVIELVEAAGSSTSLIGSIDVYQGFIVVERGTAEFDLSHDFKLDDHIKRR